jgi:D-alanyl-D-alanine carboxypeptidase/D-alanyl-D-alanine-endopeptidase (penicillin-binding protein 4)
MAQHRFVSAASRRALLAGLGATLGAALAAPALAQTKPDGKPAPKRGNPAKETTADLSDEALFQRHQIPAEAVGYLAVDGKTGQVLQSRLPAEAFVPASSIKIASTVAALALLGADHRFATAWHATGPVVDGVLRGDLVLKGGGDPLLDSDQYADAVAALKQRGIRSVAGKFVYDSSDFATARAIDADYENSAAYNPGLAALSVNFNRLKLKWERGKSPDSIAVTFTAQTDKGETPVDLYTGGWAPNGAHDPNGIVYREPAGAKPEWLLLRNPKLKAKGEIWVPVRQPEAAAAHVFQRVAARDGLTLPDPAAGRLAAGAALLHRQDSPPLGEIVARVQKYSNNMAAEMLGLAAALKLAGKPVTLPESAALVGDWLKGQIKDVDWAGFRLANHSGLSKHTRITPAQMIGVLRFARQRLAAPAYETLLYRYGIGEMEKAAAARTRIQAKTGTINYSNSLAGYMTTAAGRDVLFAVFVSDYRYREVMARAGKAYTPPAPRWWTSRARELRRQLTRRFAETL